MKKILAALFIIFTSLTLSMCNSSNGSNKGPDAAVIDLEKDVLYSEKGTDINRSDLEKDK